jgi:hypothetical protein
MIEVKQLIEIHIVCIAHPAWLESVFQRYGFGWWQGRLWFFVFHDIFNNQQNPNLSLSFSFHFTDSTITLNHSLNPLNTKTPFFFSNQSMASMPRIIFRDHKLGTHDAVLKPSFYNHITRRNNILNNHLGMFVCLF